MSTAPELDPYAPRQSFLQKHADPVAAAVVFITTVVLAIVSFPPFSAGEASGYAMLVPGIFWAYTKPSLKWYAWTLFAAQAVAWTLILGWLHNVTWVGLFLLGPFIGAWIGSWYLAAWWAMPRILGRPTLTRLIVMIGLCAFWVLIEWTRTWVLGGFPWLPLAASQWRQPSILQIAAYTGSFGVSFVLVAVNIGFAAYAHRLLRENAVGFSKRSQEFFLALFLLLGCLCLHVVEMSNRSPGQILARVAFVQPYIPQSVKWDANKAPEIANTLQTLTREAASTAPDLILWPEASTPWAVKGDDSVKGFVETLSQRANSTIFLGSIAIENRGTPKEQWFNAAFVVSPQVGLQHDYYAKRHLVPFGEYVPLKPVLGWLRKVVPIGDDFTPGPDSSPLIVRLRGEPVVFGPLICYEDVYPELARYSVRAESSILVVLTNNGWFGEGGAAYQHAAHSVLRAVEFRRPVLRCGNGGWSGWIDEYGAIRAVLTKDAEGNVHTELRFANDGTIYFRGTGTVNVTREPRWINARTYYAEHGDWFVLVCAGLVIFAFLVLRFAPVPSARSEADLTT